MDVFRSDGHLTDAALTVLAQGKELEELTRLEIAEHMAFCDLCLQRYTDLLEETELLIPEESCREGLWWRIRMRALRLVTSRYATAAAAVALALTLLWGDVPRSSEPPLWREAGSAVAEHIQQIPERWDASLEGLFSGVGGLLDQIGGQPHTNKGGTN